MEGATQAVVFEFSGGHLCLDFANTLTDRETRPQEQLNGYRDLVAWGQQAGIVPPEEGQALLVAAGRRSTEAAGVLREARVLREAIYRVFAAIAAGDRPGEADLAVLNAALARALAHARIVRTAEGFVWGWAAEAEALDRPLWPVARSAAELLVSGELAAVRECASASCNWLFMDFSRNQSRRWCDMKSCGNREKARRHYERKKATS